MKVYAIRHGQTDLNAEGRVQGKRNDLPLNDEGKRQALEAAQRLNGAGIDIIAASPMTRALETAEIIAREIGLDTKDTLRCNRLYERDFGDFEGKLISEVDADALRRWTDCAPTPNGETMRDVVSRVFDFMDDVIAHVEHKFANERREILFNQYQAEHIKTQDWSLPYGETEAVYFVKNAFSRADEVIKTMPEIKALFVVHSHVLRAMYWYFNGLPESESETAIETENCGVYEFDTEKIPQKMREYEIVLDRKTLEDRLKRLAKSPYKSSYFTSIAMCYSIATFPATLVDYVCPVCGKTTAITKNGMSSLERVRETIENIANKRLKIDALIDEREFCEHCREKAVDEPAPILKIRFSPNEKYHEVRTWDDKDYKCLTAFIKCMDEYQDDLWSDEHYPLVSKIDQIVKMTGLCPEIVSDWKAWVKEHTRGNGSEDGEDE